AEEEARQAAAAEAAQKEAAAGAEAQARQAAEEKAAEASGQVEREAHPVPASKVTVAKKVEKSAEPQPVAEAPAPRQSWFQRLRQGLSRSSRELTSNVSGLFTKRKLDEETLQDLEDVLIRADLGVETALRVTD